VRSCQRDRLGAGSAVIGKWSVNSFARQQATMRAVGENVDWPTGLLNHTVLASEDQSSMLHYSQAVDKSAFRAFADKPMECAGRWSGS
jgi:hypothetical protein